MDINNPRPKRVLELICVSVLVGILIAGLWPFRAPKNEVSWLINGSGLHFGRYGLILSSKSFRLAGLQDGISCSVEIWVQPARIDTGGTLLAFYSPENRVVSFSLHQSLDDLLLRRITAYRQRRAETKWYVGNIFRENKQMIVTITSGTRGTAVYVNGTLVGTSSRFGLSSKDLTGQLVIGNHPLGDNGWQGQFRGLDIYNRELTPAEVLQHYVFWTTNQQAEIKNEDPAALYLCNEGVGNVLHSQVNLRNDLHIPERYSVLHAPFLELPWEEFKSNWGYYKNVLINIGGFVPLGFFFCAYFSSVRRLDRAVLATVVLGGVVSLVIEVLQAFLPTRDSGMTDIITNTLGSALGAILCNCDSIQAQLATLGVAGQRHPG